MSKELSKLIGECDFLQKIINMKNKIDLFPIYQKHKLSTKYIFKKFPD